MQQKKNNIANKIEKFVSLTILSEIKDHLIRTLTLATNRNF